MNKYIKAETLILKIMANAENEQWIQLITNDTDLFQMVANKKALAELINEMPSADVVEIVRCKDCEYWDSKEKVCNHCWGGLENCRENEFCSRGERKETDDRQ